MEFLNEWYGLLLFILFDVVAVIALICIGYRWFFKRAFDLLVSGFCLIFTAPIFLIVYLRWKNFTKDGELDIPYMTETVYIGKKGKRVALRSFTRKDDDGDTLGYYGRWLKRTKFYKLPRLLDVFSGRASFVGVKAFSPVDAEFVEEEDTVRFTVRPGLINPLVLTGDESLTYEEMLASDKHYANGFSFFKDVKIFFGWLLYSIREGGRQYFGETLGKGYAETLLEEGKITREDFDIAVAEEAEE